MIVLASASPRRKELLKLITEDFIVIVSDADESSDIKDARELVRFLAQEKAVGVAGRYPKDIVIGADTVVEVEGKIFGKPRDAADARHMLETMSGRKHFVHTGICVMNGSRAVTDVCTTTVYFKDIAEEELERYLRQEDIMDKAGAYAIQEGAAKFISKIEGCFFNVVGLPVSRLYEVLKEMEKQIKI